MKKILKITAVLLIISTLICCIGCKDEKGDDALTNNTDQSTLLQGDKLTVVDNGKSDYVVVWRGRAKDAEKSAAFDLCEWIKTSTGVTLEKKTAQTVKP